MMFKIPENFERDSIFSENETYRYSLFRRWDKTKPMILFIGLNPSIADNEKNDQTQTRFQGYAERLGYGGYYVANLFALVSTDPQGLLKIKDPVGPENDYYLDLLHRTTAKTICAWGHQGNKLDDMHHNRAVKVDYNLRKTKELYVLALCSDRCPRHVLYLAQSLDPFLFRGYH